MKRITKELLTPDGLNCGTAELVENDGQWCVGIITLDGGHEGYKVYNNECAALRAFNDLCNREHSRCRHYAYSVHNLAVPRLWEQFNQFRGVCVA
jgi:hypothetical protein